MPATLPDIGNVKVAVETVEAETPRVAETVRPDLVETRCGTEERVTRRADIGDAVVDVDAQQLAEKRVDVPAVLQRVATAAAIAAGNVEETVRAKRDLATVMVAERLRDLQEDLLTAGIGDVGVGRNPVLGNDRVAAGIRVVDEEAPVVDVVRVERLPEQPLLAATRNQ